MVNIRMASVSGCVVLKEVVSWLFENFFFCAKNLALVG